MFIVNLVVSIAVDNLAIMNDNEYNLMIEPFIGLGLFKLDSGINFVMTELRSRGERYKHVEIVVGESINDPHYIILANEGIRLRFDHFYQKLELIEVDMRVIERSHDIYYKNHSIWTKDKKNSVLTYNYINSVFGPSNIPKLIDNSKHLLLRYEGVSFLFENHGVVNEESIVLGSDACLVKIAIFAEKLLTDSICQDSPILKLSIPIVKVELEKGIYISKESEPDICVMFNESVEDVLFKMRNPNYIHYKRNVAEDFENSSNSTYECDYFLNYYNYGFDIMIDGITNRVKKFIIHTNNPYSTRFGVYERSNFVIDLSKSFFKKLNENYYEGGNASSRKISEDSNNIRILDTEDVSNNDKDEFKVERNENLNFHPNSNMNQTSFKEYYNNSNLGYKDNYQMNKEETIKRRREIKASFDNNEKSFSSINESNLDISLNNSDIYMGLTVTPSTNFTEIINRIPMNSYALYHRHEPRLGIMSKFYVFDGIVFEVMDNNSIATITLFKSPNSGSFKNK